MNVKKTKAVSATPKSVEVSGLSAAVGYDYSTHVSKFREDISIGIGGYSPIQLIPQRQRRQPRTRLTNQTERLHAPPPDPSQLARAAVRRQDLIGIR